MNARKLLSAAKAVEAAYIEDVFSTYLYTGNGSTQTITNGIDIAGKGALIWTKCRNDGVLTHRLNDTVRGITNRLFSNLTDAQSASATSITATSSTGYTVGSENGFNQNTNTFVSWTFRKQAKFFDVVTYTGNGTAGQAIPHSLGVAPGLVICKRTAAASNWLVAHRGGGSGYLTNGQLNGTGGLTAMGGTAPDASAFYPNAIRDSSANTSNTNGVEFVAYLFAHDAGGFGASGSDNVISCGSFSGAGTAVTLGWEPQWLLMKQTSTTGDWFIVDNMRGWPVGSSNDQTLFPNTSAAEGAFNIADITSTGFVNGGNSGTFIYIAIRRGPMKTPTTGTSVLDTETYTGTQVARTITTANTVDLSFTKSRSTSGTRWNWTDRLRGATRTLDSSLTAAEASDTTGYTSFAVQTGYTLGTGDTYDVNTSGRTYVSWNFTRAPGFFDVVCFNPPTLPATTNHNLGVVPELMIVKRRSAGNDNWYVYATSVGNTKALRLNGTDAPVTELAWNNTTPTSTTFTVGTRLTAALDYVAYLFATCPGVSKVGTYTGTGSTLQIDCGFTGGARFVLIKRTDSTGDWYVWDSARGIVSGNDPYLLLNSTAAEVTSTDYVDTYSAGFEISSTAPAAINANGGSFIFLAIA